MAQPGQPCEASWEALRFDALPWLLEGDPGSFQWRALVELFGRPADSPAVRRAVGGANLDDPVASLLAELQPDGTWANRCGWWSRWRGNGWRLLAAVALGADPADPRLRAAGDVLLAAAPGAPGFAARAGLAPDPALTARVAAAMLALGSARQPRVQEALAWLEEAAPASPAGGWADVAGDECAVTPTALLAGYAAAPQVRGKALRERATAAVVRILAGPGRRQLKRLGYPRLRTTDLAEMVSVLVTTRMPWNDALGPALRALQGLADDGGRWARTSGVPASLPTGTWRPRVGEPSRWVTLEATVAVLAYAVPAGLPRLFPPKPSHL